MDFLSHDVYRKQVISVAEMDLPWEKLENSSLVVSGGTGLIGRFLADVIAIKNSFNNFHCSLFIIGRDRKKAYERFPYKDEPWFNFIEHNIKTPLNNLAIPINSYVIHLASNTHPVAYATDPIGTITANLFGAQNMMDLACHNKAARFVFASSNEIYGENRGDTEFFDEEYCGYIDCNTLRAGYPESKRCGEALCQAYMKQKGLDVVIPRLTRSYGPTLLDSDTKALSQFLKRALAGEDIILKSAGTQYYSYTYVADAVSGLLTVLFRGESGQAYNIADEKSDIQLKDLAQIIADYAGKKVIFEVPDAIESAGYSKATKARLDATKLKALGWKEKYNIKDGIKCTLDIMKY